MTTITYAPPTRWYWPAMALLAVGLAVATALAIYFAVAGPTAVTPQEVRVTVTPTEVGPNCARPLVPC